jgi:hypothetical protein
MLGKGSCQVSAVKNFTSIALRREMKAEREREQEYEQENEAMASVGRKGRRRRSRLLFILILLDDISRFSLKVSMKSSIPCYSSTFLRSRRL